MPHSKDISTILTEFECINQKQLQAALTHHEKNDPEKSFEETLVELGFITESDLLACLSDVFRVHHITSHKLSTVSISQGVIDLIPLEFAEEHTVLPLFCYDKAKILAVVIADCQDRQLLTHIKRVSGYTALEPYLALGSVTKAAIAKHYRNDHAAFDRLKTFFKTPLPGAIASFSPQDRHGIHVQNDDSPFSPVDRRGLSNLADQGSLSAVEEHRARRQSDHVASHSLMSENTFIEVLNIVISTLERHKDHSASVAKLVKELSGNLGSKPKETYCNVLAAYLHDCCMNSPKHLALLFFDSKDDGPLLRKYAQSSQRLFEKANLPEEVYTVLSHTFERYDGKGLPDGLKGREIPQGSRIIAVVDAYMHLLTFEKNGSNGNPYKESLATLKPLGNTYFDRKVVDALEDVIIDRLADENSPRVLIIDNEFEEIEPLVKQLKKNGIKSYVSPNTDEARYILQRSSIALVVSAFNTCPLDGLSFYNSIDEEEQCKRTPFLLGSENDDQVTVQEALDDGITDVVKKPYDVEELVAKIRNCIQQTTQDNEDVAANGIDKKGLSGNLDEIQLVDLVQMFLRGRKTGVVKLSKEKEQGEIFFDKGQVTEARYKGLDGVEAFNLLVRWQNGFFVFYPEIALPEPKIDVGTDKLLMEAYWIWDEEKVTTSELRP